MIGIFPGRSKHALLLYGLDRMASSHANLLVAT